MMETIRLPLKIETGETVYRDRNQIVRKVIAQFDGFSKEYLLSDHGQRAAVVALKNTEVLLVRQYRLLLNGLSYEIPGGRIDENESPAAAAVRECLEETGIACLDLKPLLEYLTSLEVLKNPTYIYYTEKTRDTDSTMADRRVWVPLPRCMDMIFKKQITDSLSIIGIMAYHYLSGRRRS